MWPEGHLLKARKYKVIKQIGGGGFGLTYLVEDTRLKRQVVIKTPNRQFSAEQDYERFVRRFKREGQALSKINHPNVVQVIEYFEEAGMPCLVMAHVEGETLNERVRDKGRLPQDTAVSCFRKLAEALHTLHQRGLIHCDVHPGNIILRPNGEPVVIDFGSAKLLQPDTFTITTTVNESFAPYEQNNKDNLPKPTLDVYALAATLYFAVTGQKPQASMSRKLFGDKLQPPKQLCGELENWLNESILAGMALESHARPVSIQKWIDLLNFPETTNQSKLVTPVLSSQIKNPEIQPKSPILKSQNIVKIPSPSPTFSKPKLRKNQPRYRAENTSNQKSWKWVFGLSGLVIATLGVTFGQLNNPMDQKTGDGITSRLDTVISRGVLTCGVNGSLPGFSFVDESGTYSGLDVDVCKAVAAALFDDPDAIEYRNLDSTERFVALKDGEIDMLSRNTTWTISRDTSVGMEFTPTTFFDGQGMMVRADSGIRTLEDMNGLSICVETGTTTELNLANQFRQRGVSFEPVVFQDGNSAYAAYDEGRCDGITSDKSQLIGQRSFLKNPTEHILLDVTMSKEPLGPATTNNDSNWFDVIKWVTYGLIQAEEFGLTSENVQDAVNSNDPNVLRFLGAEGTLGNDMGLPNDFMLRAIRHTGNYGQIYERNLGKESQFQLERGQNALWTEGGLMYSPPWR